MYTDYKIRKIISVIWVHYSFQQDDISYLWSVSVYL